MLHVPFSSMNQRMCRHRQFRFQMPRVVMTRPRRRSSFEARRDSALKGRNISAQGRAQRRPGIGKITTIRSPERAKHLALIVSPFQGYGISWPSFPGALPQADMLSPFGAGDVPFCLPYPGRRSAATLCPRLICFDPVGATRATRPVELIRPAMRRNSIRISSTPLLFRPESGGGR